MNKNIRKTFENITPNNYNEILLKIESEKKMKNINVFKILSGVLCVALVAVCIGFVSSNKKYKEIDSIIELDVNPSIEIGINSKDKVVKVDSNNEDGKKVLGSMDLLDTNVDVAINAIIGSMLKEGYISTEQNSILVSVLNDDIEKGKQLENKIVKDINDVLTVSNIEPSILTQEISGLVNNSEKKDNISVGKSKLISEIVSKDSTLKYNDLVEMSINELNILNSKVECKDNCNVKTQGTASVSAYIGSKKARTIAYEHAKVSSANVLEYEVEFDSEKGILVYDVDFSTKKYDYEYYVNAKTGEIIFNEKEVNDDYVEEDKGGSSQSSNTSKPSSSTSSTSTSIISKSKAKSIALSKAGVSASSIFDYEIEYDREDNDYEISFNSGKYEYDIEIDARTGKVIDFDKEIND